MSVTLSLAVFAAAVSTLGALLGLGIVRRLRELQDRLSSIEGHDARRGGLRRGARIPELAAVDTDGVPFDNLAAQVGPSVWAFFSAACASCKVDLPAYLARSDDAAQYVAVLNGDPEEFGDIGAHPWARVLVEQELGPVTTAFDVWGFPTYFLVVDGRVMESVGALEQLPRPIARGA